MITQQMLIAIDARAQKAPAAVADAWNAAWAEFGITDPMEQAGLIGVCTAETGGFTITSENLNYTSADRLVAVFPSRFHSAAEAQPYVHNPQKIANRVYAGKLGNGDEASGDGWRYRGRGYIQLTGKSLYTPCLVALFGAATADPDQLLQPKDAARSACWYWHMAGCDKALKAQGMDAVTRIVNGPAMLQAKERKAFFDKAYPLLKGGAA